MLRNKDKILPELQGKNKGEENIMSKRIHGISTVSHDLCNEIKN